MKKLKKKKQVYQADSGINLKSALDYALPALSIADAFIPEPIPKSNLNQFPTLAEYNSNPYGTGSQAIYEYGGKLKKYPIGGNTNTNPPKKGLSDMEIYQGYLNQFSGEDAPRKAAISFLAKKYNVPTENIITSTNFAHNTNLPKYRDYTILGNDGKELLTLRNVIGGDAVGEGGSTEGNAPKEYNPIGNDIASNSGVFEDGGLSRAKDYKSKKKPYPSVNSSDFAGPHRSYPIPSKQDAVDALRLAGLHHNNAVKQKVYAKYPELRKGNSGLSVPYEEGKTYDLSQSEINKLIAQGYKVQY